MDEKILVPLDGSKVGEAALPYVEDLVSKLSPEVKVEITLLQVVASTHDVVAGEASAKVPYTEKEMGQIKDMAVNYLNKAGESLRGKGVVINCKVAFGKAADEIIKTADETNVDLIAMSTHGRSGLSRLAFGSVTEKVLHGRNVPVLTVRGA
ncbi:universal stress protein [Chloroflexota bacterium]